MMRLLSVVAALLGVAPAAAQATGPAATPGARVLSGVSCPRVTSCWAVGAQTASGVTRTLIEHWNGRTWSLQASPSVPASSDTFLMGVSCSARLNCWAVGGAAVGTTKQEPIAEHWNGRTWSLRVLPEPAGLPADGLSGVRCLVGGRCWAVGSAARAGFGASRPLAEHWNGRKWSIVRTVSPGNFTNLNGVTCRRDADCWAVGAGLNGGLAEHWNGTKWSTARTPATGAGLISVACPSPDCIAVGVSGFPSAIAERWNGSKWSLMHTPPLPVGAVSSFSGVSCVTSSDCVSVGSFSGVSAIKTLIERFRGLKWVIVKSPNPAGMARTTLRAVVCTSSRNCWAVGSQGKTEFGSTGGTLAEHWNGTRWSIVRTP